MEVKLIISLFRVKGLFIMKGKKLRMCKGYLYSNASHLILFMSNIYRYVPIQISNVSEDIILFISRRTLGSDSVNLRKKYVQDTLDMKWS